MPTVSVAGHDVAVEAQPGEPILAALSRRGYAHRFGCRRGGCGLCKVHLISGDVDYTRPVAATVLPEVDRRDGVCLSCRAVPISDIVIRLAEGDTLHCVAPFLRDLRGERADQPPRKGTNE